MPHLTSSEYNQISDITSFVKGRMTELIMSARMVKFNQSADGLKFGQERFRRTNTLEAHCGSPTIVGKCLSLQYTVYTYYAGAAHPNYGFDTFSFIIDPLVYIENIASIFVNDRESLDIIIQGSRSKLLAGFKDDRDRNGDSMHLDSEWIERGTSEWSDFRAFVFKEGESSSFCSLPSCVICGWRTDRYCRLPAFS